MSAHIYPTSAETADLISQIGQLNFTSLNLGSEIADDTTGLFESHTNFVAQILEAQLSFLLSSLNVFREGSYSPCLLEDTAAKVSGRSRGRFADINVRSLMKLPKPFSEHVVRVIGVRRIGKMGGKRVEILVGVFQYPEFVCRCIKALLRPQLLCRSQLLVRAADLILRSGVGQPCCKYSASKPNQPSRQVFVRGHDASNRFWELCASNRLEAPITADVSRVCVGKCENPCNYEQQRGCDDEKHKPSGNLHRTNLPSTSSFVERVAA